MVCTHMWENTNPTNLLPHHPQLRAAPCLWELCPLAAVLRGTVRAVTALREMSLQDVTATCATNS